MAKKKSDIEEVKVIDIPKGNVIVIGTHPSAFLKANVEYTVSSELAQTLIKKGAATLK